MKILIILGTRAEYIKIVPIFRELKKQKMPFRFLATGQHNFYSQVKEFGFKPEYYLTKPPKLTSRFMNSKVKALFWLVKVFFKLRKILKKEKYLVICHGDTMSGVIVAIAAKFAKQKVAHVEGLLRSFCDKEPFPEEKFRKIIDKYSDILFVPTKIDAKNLTDKNKRVWITGNTSIDLIKSYNIKPKEGNYIVISIHRTENLSSELRMRMIVTAMNNLNLPIILFAHDNFLCALDKFNLKLSKTIKIEKLISHKKFIKKLAGCKFCIVDGGGIQEEATFLKKPCILMRAYTERYGYNFGDGNASKKIVEVLKTLK